MHTTVCSVRDAAPQDGRICNRNIKGVSVKTSALRAWLGAVVLGLAAAMPARAELVVTFEDAAPALFSSSSITSGDFTFTSFGSGFSGVDNASAFSAFANAPANADGQFLFMLNSDGMGMSRTDGNLFFLDGFDASFIAPLGGLGSGLFAGELFVGGLTGTGAFLFDTFVFSASDANGNFNFSSFVTSALHGVALSEVGFVACIYEADGSCSLTGNTVPPQFALDNLDVPEPGSLALMAIALAALGIPMARRRRQSL